MSKVDYKKELKHLYHASSKEAVLVKVPAMRFLMIDGVGDPNTSKEFQDAVEALFSVSYTLKFMIKNGPSAIDYSVMPLEGLWWVDDMTQFSTDHKDVWKWTLMIMQPEFITENLMNKAIEKAVQKRELPASDKLRFNIYAEDLSAQILHQGPFSAEKPTIDKLHNYIKEKGYQCHGFHHEIYLNDMRKTAPEKLKTIIRQPVTK